MATTRSAKSTLITTRGDTSAVSHETVKPARCVMERRHGRPHPPARSRWSRTASRRSTGMVGAP